MKKICLMLALVAIGCSSPPEPSPTPAEPPAVCEVWDNGRMMHVITDESYWQEGCPNCRLDLNNNMVADSYEINSSTNGGR